MRIGRGGDTGGAPLLHGIAVAGVGRVCVAVAITPIPLLATTSDDEEDNEDHGNKNSGDAHLELVIL